MNLDDLVFAAGSAYSRVFQDRPSHAALAPGRVNLIGEHTDYNAGFVLPIAIDRACKVFAAVAPAGVPSRFVSLDAPGVAEFDLQRVTPADLGACPWARYAVGALVGLNRRLREMGGPVVPNLHAVFSSTVPLGSGLSSSAAIECAALMLGASIAGVTLESGAAARIAQQAEHEFAGVPCGIMDQLVSVAARPGCATLIDCRSLEVGHVPIPSGAAIIVANSGVKHALGDSGYPSRRRDCEAAAGALGVGVLRDLDPAGGASDAGVERLRVGEHLLTPTQFKRARHVVTENARVLRAADALRAGDLQALGGLMFESHASLRDDFEVSCEELDSIVDIARGIEGVHGARMTGGGFGGCAVVLAEHESCELVMAELDRMFAARHGRSCVPMRVRSPGGARVLELPGDLPANT